MFQFYPLASEISSKIFCMVHAVMQTLFVEIINQMFLYTLRTTSHHAPLEKKSACVGFYPVQHLLRMSFLDITHSVSFMHGWTIVNTSHMGLPISYVIFCFVLKSRESNISFQKLRIFPISRCAYVGTGIAQVGTLFGGLSTD